MPPAHGGAVARVDGELFLEEAVELDARPVDRAGGRGIFQHGHEQIAHALQLHLARASGPGLGEERVEAAGVEELDPQAHHAVGATELLADGGPREAQEQRAQGGQTEVGTLVGRGFHRHAQFVERGVLGVGMDGSRAQHPASTIPCSKVQGKSRRTSLRKFLSRFSLTLLRTPIRFELGLTPPPSCQPQVTLHSPGISNQCGQITPTPHSCRE